jgi:hypothetical protein
MRGAIKAPRMLHRPNGPPISPRSAHECGGKAVTPILVESKNGSHQVRWHSLNRTHVIVQNSLLASIVPPNGNASPILFGNGATVGLIALPANTVTNGEMS